MWLLPMSIDVRRLETAVEKGLQTVSPGIREMPLDICRRRTSDTRKRTARTVSKISRIVRIQLQLGQQKGIRLLRYDRRNVQPATWLRLPLILFAQLQLHR